MATIVIINLNIGYTDSLIDSFSIFSGKNVQENGSSLIKDVFFQFNNNINVKSKAKCCGQLVNLDSMCVRNLIIKNDYPLKKTDQIQSGKANLTVKLDHFEKTCIDPLSELMSLSNKRITVNMNGYVVSSFIQYLMDSPTYLELFSEYMSCICKNPSPMIWRIYHGVKIGFLKLQINLEEPERHVMDLKWANMACASIQEMRHLQYALSWLSTLGGAFSALGEQQERCAINAGMISIEQLRLSMKLGDAITITQCKLYFSLSLIQRGYCRKAKKIIEEEFRKLKTHFSYERKTLNMCRGIWARLKYEIQRRKLLKTK